MLSIYSGNSPIKHNFNNKSDYIPVGTLDAAYIQNATGFDVQMINQTTSKQILNGHTYQIKTQYTLIIDQGQIKGIPTMKDSTVFTQIIENDVLPGTIKITEQEHKFHKLNTFIDYVINSQGETIGEKVVYKAYTEQVENKLKTYWLNDFMNYMQPETATTGSSDFGFGENIIQFKTKNTAETQMVLSKIDANYKTTSFGKNGEVFPTVESSYSNTNFTNPNLYIYLIIRSAED